MSESGNDRQNRLIRERLAAKEAAEREAARIKQELVDEANRNHDNR
jgi:hypothetical protein